MFFFRSAGLRGLGEALTAGYCFLNGVWTWTTADKCPQPLIAGGAPATQTGFCWIRDNPPAAFPGHWERARTGQACQYEGPPSAPTVAAGWCQNAATGQWEYVLATQCVQPVQSTPPASGPIVRTGGGRPTVGEYRSRRTINALITQFVERWATRRHDVIMGLYATDLVKPCADVMGARAARWCEAEFAKGNFKVLDPIGVIVELGVPFSPEELGAGVLEKVYTPTDDQRFMADVVIYGAAQRQLAELLDPGGPELVDAADFWRSPLYPLLAITGESTFMRRIARSTLSVQQLLERFQEFVLSVPGFSLNPDPPTPDELTQPGGLLAYYRRGGYVLSTQSAGGTMTVARAGITWNTGYCACGEGGTPMATFKYAAGEGFGWDIKITVGPQYKIRITPRDAPWWSEAASFVAGKLKDLAKFICSNREIIQQVNSGVLLKEICTNPDGTPCTKGAAGCTCTQPTTVQQGAVGVANVAMGAWCSRVETWDKPKETPFTPPPPEAKAVRWPFVVTGLVGAIVGGLFASRTRR